MTNPGTDPATDLPATCSWLAGTDRFVAFVLWLDAIAAGRRGDQSGGRTTKTG